MKPPVRHFTWVAMAAGRLNITNGGAVVSSRECYIGTGSTGTAWSTALGSTFTCSGLFLEIGSAGTGTLNIANGATVAAGQAATDTISAGAPTGSINFGPNGGTLTTNSICVSAGQLSGTGTINTHGLVSDMAVVFDSPSSLNQTVTLNQPGKNIAFNLSIPTNNSGDLGTGVVGNGSLTIRNGVTVNCHNGYLGYLSGSTGVATVGRLDMAHECGALSGYAGSGTLNITGGGTLSTFCDASVGELNSSTGTVTVNGVRWSWTSTAGIFLGQLQNATGTVNIINGGTVTAKYVECNSSTSRLAIDNQSLLQISCSTAFLSATSGAIANDGTVRIFVGAGSVAGSVCQPISASTS